MTQHLVFVYGTLKRGFHNHCYLYGAEFVMDAITQDATFDMLSLDGAVPMVMPNGDCHIRGEVYRGPDGMMDLLDFLESNTILYERKLLPVMSLDRQTIVNAWVYLGFPGRLYRFADTTLGVEYNQDENTLNWIDILDLEEYDH